MGKLRKVGASLAGLLGRPLWALSLGVRGLESAFRQMAGSGAQGPELSWESVSWWSSAGNPPDANVACLGVSCSDRLQYHFTFLAAVNKSELLHSLSNSGNSTSFYF